MKTCSYMLIFVSFMLALTAGSGLAGTLADVSVMLDDPTAGLSSAYYFEFTTSAAGNGSDVGLPVDGKIEITFSADFNISSILFASSQNSNMNGGFLIRSTSNGVVIIQRDSTGNFVAGNKQILIGVAMIGNPADVQSSSVTVTTLKADDTPIDTGVSADFQIVAGEVDHFSLASISSQTAGTSFLISITAQDQEDNTVTGFSGTANILDLTGTLNTTATGNFTNGEWSGSISITEAISNNRLTVTSIGRAGESNSFAVEPGSVAAFSIEDISSPRTAGTQFTISITALDEYENQVTDFQDVATLKDQTGTISPAQTTNFSNGTWSGAVQITESYSDNNITVSNSGKTGSSNSFNVNAAALDQFRIENISTQAAGIYFPITVFALDNYNNTVTDFTGNVNIEDRSGTISPVASGSFTAGIWTGTVEVTQTYSGDVITVTENGRMAEGSSNSFDVTASDIDHFTINNISSPQTAGNSFSITISAKDAENNTVTDFTGTANLSEATGTISPKVTDSFKQGVWTGTVTITETETGNTITVSSSGKSGTSNSFTVNAAALDHFTLEAINSPQTAGETFSISITAEDEYGNQVTSFSDRVDLTDDTGTIDPGTSGRFSAGSWSGNVSITQSENDVQITATGSGKTGESNKFNVQANDLDHFEVAPISTQAAGETFSITVTALDEFDNLVTDFTNTVDLSDLTGTLSPTVSSNFSQGQWTGSMVISQARTNNTISVQRTGGNETGESNGFDVISSSIDHFDISTISSPQTAGAGFSVTITAKDAENNTVTGFTGTANIRDLTGTISPVTTTSFTNGVWTGEITVTQSYSANSLTITSSGKAGTSNDFDVNPAALSQFAFETIGSPQTAGTGFEITLRAEDVYGNVVTGYSNQVNLSDVTGTISPTRTGAMVSGVWTGTVSIDQSQDDVYITASRNGVTGESNKFNVDAAQLQNFILNTIDTQIAGQPFALLVTAKDSHSNTVTGFTGSVSIQDQTGTISPQASGNFSAGVWSGNVTVSQTVTNNLIEVQKSGGTESGQSNTFNVVSNSVDHFEINTISSPQTAGNSFQITITAKDAQNNTVSTFNSTAGLSDLTGTISPQTSGAFSNGVRTETVTITTSTSSNTISVTSGGKAGTSNTFSLNPASLDHFEFSAISSPQEASVAFSITIIARDIYENQVTGFTGAVSLSDNTGSINPAATGAFTGGEWTGKVSISTPQNDVKITASGSGKNGYSNLFNVTAGALHHFTMDQLSTQFAGESFVLTVTAMDVNENQVASFGETVTISDETGTISPSKSGNFSTGQWVGNVTISQATEEDIITVQRSGGTEKGTSNTFGVTASSVDHYEIATISSPQTAGVAFTIQIMARDADNNLVTDFTGSLKLSDKTASISPTLTGNFTAGVWEDTVSIRQSYTENVISATNGTRAGSSNPFNVVPKPLDHFTVSAVSSPQTAGVPFEITIQAVDVYENVVTTFTNQAYLTAPGAEISPANTDLFIAGAWTGNVTIPNQQSDVFVQASYNSITGQSNSFNVEPSGLHHLMLRDQPGGFGNEVADVILTLDDKLKIYAAGYDLYNNYVRDVAVNWSVTGTLELPQPVFGSSTTLDPTVPGSEGKIIGDTTGVNPDTTGLISVGTISWVKIRTAPGGNGVELGAINLTADDSISLYAAGYDAGGNYLGEVSVFWQSTGDLEPVLADTSTSRVFAPTTAPRAGTVFVTHATATGDETGTIQVTPGSPVGRIVLTPVSTTLPADGVSTTIIESDSIFDGDGNWVSNNTLFTVRTTKGQIVSPADASAEYDEWQVTPNDSGVIAFVLQASTAGGTAFVTVNSTVEGGASGETVVNMSSLKVVSIVTEPTTVSRGQTAIPVNVLVENIGSQGVTQLNAGLKFTGPAPVLADRSTDYPVVTRTDEITQIPGGSRQTLSFMVSVGSVAVNDTITIDAWVSGYAGESLVSDSSAEQPDKWRVQIPAEFLISRIEAFSDTVSQGLDNVSVSMTIKNTGEAGALINLANLRFWSIDENRNLPSDYQVFPAPGNPQMIQGLNQAQLNFTLNVSPTATLGQVVLNGSISGSDINSSILINDAEADTLDNWVVASAAVVGITSFRPSQFSVSQSQTQQWHITMIIKNNATSSVGLDSAKIKFLIGGSDITDEYTLYTPTYFMGSGNNQLTGGRADSIRFVVLRTGTTLGPITIEAAVHLTDLQTGKSMTRSQKTGVTVMNPGLMTIDQVIPSQTRVTINQEVPWTVRVVLSNEGGSDIVIQPENDATYVSIQPESGFEVTQPTGLQKAGNWTLRGGGVDTLIFTVTRSGSLLGGSNLSVAVSGVESNTGQPVTISSSENIRIDVENPAQLRIFSVDSKALNGSQVNTGQTFKIQARIQNPVTESSDVQEVDVLLTSNGNSIDSLRQTVSLVPGGGELRSAFFDVTAAREAASSEIFTAEILTSRSANTGAVVPVLSAVDSSENIIIQTAAQFSILKVIVPVTIRANQRDWWSIHVVVFDSGGASLRFAKPSIQDVEIAIDGDVQKDYIVEPPPGLQNGGLVLNSGVIDTLIYWVTTTGEQSGIAEIQVNLSPTDRNSGQELTQTAQAQIEVRTSARVVIRETLLRNCRIDPVSRMGQANYEQQFRVTAVIRNVGREAIENIHVQLRSNRQSKITDTNPVINYLPGDYGAIDSVYFTVEADTLNRTEKFTASIISAYVQGTTIPATIEVSTDSTAMVQIMKQAELKPKFLQDDSVFTISQVVEFPVLVENLGEADIDDSGILTFSAPAQYRIITPAGDTTFLSATGSFEADEPVNWTLLTPGYASGPDTIIVSISRLPVDQNSSESAFAPVRHDTLVIETLPTKFLISSYQIIKPQGAGDNILSQGQRFTVQAMLNFSQNLHPVTAEIIRPEKADYLINPGSSYRQNVSGPGPVEWTLIAPTQPDAAEVVLELKITAYENGTPLLIQDTLKVKTVFSAELSVGTWISDPPGARDSKRSIATGQTFEIKAEVKNRPLAARTSGAGHLEIDFGVTGIQTEDSLVKTFALGEAVTWQATAPTEPATLADIIVRIIEAPDDENTDAPANIASTGRQDTIAIQTVAAGNLTHSIGIKAPLGAKDGIFSSGQRFQVEAQFQNNGVTDIFCELHLPVDKNFTLVGSQRKELEAGQSTISFTVVAPEDTVENALLWIQSEGRDQNNAEHHIYVTPDSLRIRVVKKAELKLTAGIIEPEAARDNIISLGSTFKVRLDAENLGTANFYSSFEIEIKPPGDYVLIESEPAKKDCRSGFVEWIVRAPKVFHRVGRNINFEVTQIPLDENTDSLVTLRHLDPIIVATGEKSLKISKIAAIAPKSVTRGEKQVPMLGLILENLENGDASSPILLSALKIRLADKNGQSLVNPAAAVTRLSIASAGDHDNLFGSVNAADFRNQNPVHINFSQIDTIHSDKPDSLVLLVSIAGQTDVPAFQITIDSTAWFDISIEGADGFRPTVKNEAGSTVNALALSSGFSVILEADLEKSFCNYPNPFGRIGMEKTTFVYYLAEETVVELRIYTLLGELVWHKQFLMGEPETKAGTHDSGNLAPVFWDGKNDAGYTVLNGIYIAVLTIGDGKSVTTKTAFIK